MFKGQHILLAKVILLLQIISLIFQALPSQRDCQLRRIKQGGTEEQLDEAGEEPRGAACAGGATGGTPPSERSLLRSAQPRGAGGTRRDLRGKVPSFSGC